MRGAPRPRRAAPSSRRPLAFEVIGDVALIEQCTAVDLDSDQLASGDLLEHRGSADAEHTAHLLDSEQARQQRIQFRERRSSRFVSHGRYRALAAAGGPARLPHHGLGRRRPLAVARSGRRFSAAGSGQSPTVLFEGFSCWSAIGAPVICPERDLVHVHDSSPDRRALTLSERQLRPSAAITQRYAARRAGFGAIKKSGGAAAPVAPDANARAAAAQRSIRAGHALCRLGMASLLVNATSA
jgi:hypothetical protein